MVNRPCHSITAVIIKDIYHPANDFCELNNDLETINSWSKQWLTTINTEKTNYLILLIG
jgi:hypothetical protein